MFVHDLCAHRLGNQPIQLFSLDSLSLKQGLSDVVQGRTMLCQQILSRRIGMRNDLFYLFIHELGQIFAVVALFDQVTSQENRPMLASNGHGTDLLAHPELGDHTPCDVRDAFQIVLGACGDFLEDHILGDTPPKHGRKLSHKLGARNQIPVFFRKLDRITHCHASWQNCDFVDRSCLRKEFSHQRMPCLVISHDAPLIDGHHAAAAFWPGDNSVYCFFEFGHRKLSAPAPCSKQRRLIDHILKVGSSEANGAPGKHHCLYIGADWLAFEIKLDDLLPPFQVRRIDYYAPVEPARAQQSRVKYVGAVGRGQHDDACLGIEAVHLDEQGVKGLLSLIVPTPKPGAP